MEPGRGAVTARRAGRASGHAKALKGARYALWKNPGNLTETQQAKLAWVAKTDPRLYRAYLLKEGLRLIFQLPHEQAGEALQRWVTWARRCRIEAFVTLRGPPRGPASIVNPVLPACPMGGSNR